MKRPWQGTLSVALIAIVSALLMASPVGAAEVVSETGTIGRYDLVDTLDSPETAGAICKYTGSPIDWFRWMRVTAPQVLAADTSSAREHRTVGWRVRLQRASSPGGPWTTTVTSAEERAVAYDNTPAVLHPIVVKYQSAHTNLIYRALVVIRWYHGSVVEGSALLRIQYYHYRAADANPTYVATDNCANRSD